MAPTEATAGQEGRTSDTEGTGEGAPLAVVAQEGDCECGCCRFAHARVDARARRGTCWVYITVSCPVAQAQDVTR